MCIRRTLAVVLCGWMAIPGGRTYLTPAAGVGRVPVDDLDGSGPCVSNRAW